MGGTGPTTHRSQAESQLHCRKQTLTRKAMCKSRTETTDIEPHVCGVNAAAPNMSVQGARTVRRNMSSPGEAWTTFLNKSTGGVEETRKKGGGKNSTHCWSACLGIDPTTGRQRGKKN